MLISTIRNMQAKDVDAVAIMVALDHDNDSKKGYREARQHTLDHLEIVPEHCYVIENDKKQVIATMVLHPQEKIFEIEDFVKNIEQNKEARNLLKAKFSEYLANVHTEDLCCPYAITRLMKTY